MNNHSAHSTEPTTEKKCLYCHRIIYTNSTEVPADDFFCSKKCWLKFRFLKVKRLIQNVLSQFRHRQPQPTTDKKPLPIDKLYARADFRILILIILIVMASLTANVILYRQIKRIETRLTRFKITDERAHVNLNLTNQLNIHQPPPEAMVTKNVINIEGQARENSIVCVLNNDKIVAVTLTRNGIFAFKNVTINRSVNHLVVKSISDSGETLSLQRFDIDYHPPSLEYLARDFKRGDLMHPQIALTFDGDYLNNVASPILDILKGKKVRATFFLTARFIQKYQYTVRRIVDEGHEVGNHTWSHPHLTLFEEQRQHLLRPGVTREFLQNEIKKTADLFQQVAGVEMSRIWRAPFGEHNYQIRSWAAELGYRQIGWTTDHQLKLSLDTADWVADKSNSLYRKPATILENLIEFADKNEHGANGGIILMHLGSQREDEFPHHILGAAIDSLHQRGYEFVTISSMTF